MIILTLVVLAILSFYMQSYFKIQKETQIIQTTLTSFHPDILLEKQPIYVNDNIYNPADVIASIFKYQYVQKVLSLSNKSYLKRNLSKFVLIYNDQDQPIHVYIANPTTTKHMKYYNGFFVNKFYKVCKKESEIQNDEMIKIILKPNNMFVIPMGWIYKTDVDNVLEIHLFDCISRVYSFFA